MFQLQKVMKLNRQKENTREADKVDQQNFNFDIQEVEKEDLETEDNFDLVLMDKYHYNPIYNRLLKEEKDPNDKIVKLYDNNKKEIIFPSGVKKEIYPDGYYVVFFNNYDIKQVIPSHNHLRIRFFLMVNVFIITIKTKL